MSTSWNRLGDFLVGLCAGSSAISKLSQMKSAKMFMDLPTAPSDEEWALMFDDDDETGVVPARQSLCKPWDEPNHGITFRYRHKSPFSNLSLPSRREDKLAANLNFSSAISSHHSQMSQDTLSINTSTPIRPVRPQLPNPTAHPHFAEAIILAQEEHLRRISDQKEILRCEAISASFEVSDCLPPTFSYAPKHQPDFTIPTVEDIQSRQDLDDDVKEFRSRIIKHHNSVDAPRPKHEERIMAPLIYNPKSKRSYTHKALTSDKEILDTRAIFEDLKAGECKGKAQFYDMDFEVCQIEKQLRIKYDRSIQMDSAAKRHRISREEANKARRAAHIRAQGKPSAPSSTSRTQETPVPKHPKNIHPYYRIKSSSNFHPQPLVSGLAKMIQDRDAEEYYQTYPPISTAYQDNLPVTFAPLSQDVQSTRGVTEDTNFGLDACKPLQKASQPSPSIYDYAIESESQSDSENEELQSSRCKLQIQFEHPVIDTIPLPLDVGKLSEKLGKIHSEDNSSPSSNFSSRPRSNSASTIQDSTSATTPALTDTSRPYMGLSNDSRILLQGNHGCVDLAIKNGTIKLTPKKDCARPPRREMTIFTPSDSEDEENYLDEKVESFDHREMDDTSNSRRGVEDDLENSDEWDPDWIVEPVCA